MLDAFSKGSQKIILDALKVDTNIIDSDSVQNVLDDMGIEIGTMMIMLLPSAAGYARVPISDFHVGAVALGMAPSAPIRGPGSLYLGSNMEFTGQALSFCMHGEQSATNNAWLHGETGLQALAINAAPCGYCRQFLNELSTAKKGFNILLRTSDNPTNYSYSMNPLSYYLPDSFGPNDLGIKGSLMTPQSHNLSLQTSDPVALAALDAANQSYAPYTSDFAGVAIQTGTGKIFAGRLAENAAYNPSMSPMESALGVFNMTSSEQVPYDIVKCVLVEAGGSKSSQKDATEAVLTSVAPSVTLEYFAI